MKCMQVNGIAIDKEVYFTALYQGNEFIFCFMPYTKFMEEGHILLNREAVGPCDTVVVYSSMGNNSMEVYYIKIFLSILYFAYRIRVEERRKAAFFIDEKDAYSEYGANVSDDVLEERYKEEESPVIKNWNIRGFWNSGNIERLHWCVSLGKREMSDEDFESYLSRGYGDDLCDSFDRKGKFDFYVQHLIVDDEVLRHVRNLNFIINRQDTIGNKLKSAMRLYYEIFMIYSNMNLSIITISTILETLLLGKDEDNQRKKVSVRSACLICDGMDKKWKSYLSDCVYFFYKYRNAIVHDGKNYLDFNEVQLNTTVENMKHVIFEIVRCMVDRQLENAVDIKQIVSGNQQADGLANAFDYISSDAGEVYHMYWPED